MKLPLFACFAPRKGNQKGCGIKTPKTTEIEAGSFMIQCQTYAVDIYTISQLLLKEEAK